MTHALITGPITGRIPHGDGAVNVTPDVLYFDTEDEARAVADSIEAEHIARGTHPIQLEAEVLALHPDEFHPDVHKEHKARVKSLIKKAGL